MKDIIRDMSDFHLDVLREISNIGAGNAATALSQLLGKPVNMRVSRVIPMPFNDVTEYVGGAENLVTTVFSRIDGDITGNMLFVMGAADGGALVRHMAGDNGEGDGELSEFAQSVLQEVGNILSGSYLTALSDFTGFDLRTSVPCLCVDMAGAILSFGLMETGKSSDYAILIDAEILPGGNDQNGDVQSSSGHIFLLPDPESFHRIFFALGVHRYGSN
ncbi:CheY-P-specific phosphatase CheC [Heliobacterium gestii]|uniref:CheY-P-specific phosphatase CheC n=1 Tax=Heliomicrobium gestii TaxID=2699 RepID=A0A845LAQ0_HELGE|nr:chemotaxis protein CheC [Heliomicrobium gestii]MBM7865487.1 chemotaxis protein CheC [Heliomicrobium gestii]MZP41739.1 CheY-P-specific phosphatase CheC [Heliomicrobium gestii]